MKQRRLRPSQGGRFLTPVVPSLVDTHLVVERNEYARRGRGPVLLMPAAVAAGFAAAGVDLDARIVFGAADTMHIEDVRWIP